MKIEERVVTYPIMGKKNSEITGLFLDSLGLNVLAPSPITDETIKKGVKYSPDMMCFPYKVTLGSYIESLERGANTLLMYDNKGSCRLKQYNKLHEFTLEGMGFDFEMIPVTLMNFVPRLSKISGKDWAFVLKKFNKYFGMIQNEDSKYSIWSEEKPNIGIIGEIYCACDERANHHLEDKIKKFGATPYNTARVGDFIKDRIKKKLGVFNFELFNGEIAKFRKLAKGYFNGDLGGHSLENIANLMHMCERKVDGIIHIFPLSCMPEATIEPYINKICRDNNVPLLRLYIDENNSEVNLETRLETFIELIKWKK
jgi:predicted nucleotide-binding protein (sugar kinase/HSP70/actin superfamily)